MYLVSVLVLLSCSKKDESLPRMDLDQFDEREVAGFFASRQDSEVITQFEAAPKSVREDSVDRILGAAYAYRVIGKTDELRMLCYRVRALSRKHGADEYYAAFLVSLYLAEVFLVHQNLDSARYYLNVSDSYCVQLKRKVEHEKIEIHQDLLMRVLERQGKSDSIIMLWKNRCNGQGEQILARALRKKNGKERMKSGIEYALKYPVVTPAKLIWRGKHRLLDPEQVLPDGDTIPMRDFGGLFVRLDLPGKSCYLWAPPDQDSITSLPAYLNNFRKTRFCKILQDIDPDARE